jgi:AcrR family transcriptional regulator
MTPRPRVEEERKSQIITAALHCFARDGYDATSMDAIAAEAGLSKALLYYYYKSKDDVFESGFDAWIRGSTEESIRVLDVDQPRASLLQFARMTASLTDESSELFGLLLTYWEMAQRKQVLLERLRDAMNSVRSVLIEVLDAGVRIGEFPSMDTHLVAVVLFATLDGLWVHCMLDPDSINLGEAAYGAISLFIQGLEGV